LWQRTSSPHTLSFCLFLSFSHYIFLSLFLSVSLYLCLFISFCLALFCLSLSVCLSVFSLFSLPVVNFINILHAHFSNKSAFLPKLNQKKSCAKHFRMKNAHVKCWWNWHLEVQSEILVVQSRRLKVFIWSFKMRFGLFKMYSQPELTTTFLQQPLFWGFNFIFCNIQGWWVTLRSYLLKAQYLIIISEKLRLTLKKIKFIKKYTKML